MTTQTMTADTSFALPNNRVGSGSTRRLRRTAALAIGWVAYGLFYLTVLGAVVGLPAGLSLYLLGIWPN